MSDFDATNLSDAQLLQALQGTSAAPGSAPAAAPQWNPGPVMDAGHPLASAMAADAPANADMDPSTLSDSQIQAILQTNPVRQWEGWSREPALAASNATKGAVETLGIPGSLVHGYSQYIGAPLERWLGVKNPPVFDNRWTAQHLLETTNAAGLTDRPDLQPQGLGEEYLAEGARGAGSAVPYVLTGGGGLLSDAGRLAVGGAAGGAGQKLASDWLPSHPLAASILGSAAGMLTGNAGYDLVARGVDMARGDVSPLIEAMERQGVTPRLVGDVTGRPFWQKQQAYLFDNPNAAGPVRAAAQQTLDQTADAVERTAGSLDPARAAMTGETTGRIIQAEARNWDNVTRPTIESRAWAPVNAKIPATAPTPLTNYEAALGDLTQHAGRLTASSQSVLPQKAQQLLDALHQDLGAPAPGPVTAYDARGIPVQIPQSASAPQPIMPATWAEAQRFRSLVGEARGDPEIVQALGTKNLNRLYAALSQDMRGTAVRAGAGADFDAANATSTALHTFRKNVVARLISSPRNALQEGMTGDQTTSAALNGGDYLLTSLRSQMPRAADALGAYTLRDSILARPSWQNAAGTQASAGTFLTDLSQLRQNSPAGYEALFRPVRDDVDDLTDIAHSMRETARNVNTSKTAANSELARGPWLRGAVGAELGGRVGEFVGHPGEGAAIGGATGLIGQPLWDSLKGRFVTNPSVARWLSTPIEQATRRQQLIQALAPPLAAYAGGDLRRNP